MRPWFSPGGTQRAASRSSPSGGTQRATSAVAPVGLSPGHAGARSPLPARHLTIGRIRAPCSIRAGCTLLVTPDSHTGMVRRERAHRASLPRLSRPRLPPTQASFWPCRTVLGAGQLKWCGGWRPCARNRATTAAVRPGQTDASLRRLSRTPRASYSMLLWPSCCYSIRVPCALGHGSWGVSVGQTPPGCALTAVVSPVTMSERGRSIVTRVRAHGATAITVIAARAGRNIRHHHDRPRERERREGIDGHERGMTGDIEGSDRGARWNGARRIDQRVADATNWQADARAFLWRPFPPPALSSGQTRMHSSTTRQGGRGKMTG